MKNNINTAVVITTFNREDLFWEVYNSIDLRNVVCFIIQDSSDKHRYSDLFYGLNKSSDTFIIESKENVGIGKIKNIGINEALKHPRNEYDKGFEHIFIVEDDIYIKDNGVWDYFIKFSEVSGIKHTNWNGVIENKVLLQHEYNNKVKAEVRSTVHGSFQYFHRDVFDEVEIDEVYFNALEHIDLEYQMSEKGIIPPYWYFVSPANCEDYLECLDEGKSTITGKDGYNGNVKSAAKHWVDKWGYLPSKIPKVSKAKFDRELFRIQDKFGCSGSKYKKPISIICTIKDRCHFSYKSQEELLPQELNLLKQHDSIITQMNHANEGKGGIKLNQQIFSNPEGFRPFDNFLKSLNKQAKSYNGKIELVVVDWSSKDDDVEDIIKCYWGGDYNLVTISHDEKFSRGYALDMGVKKAKYELLHFTDIDMTYETPRFLEDCGSLDGNAIFPIITKERSPSRLFLYLECAGYGVSSMEKSTYLESGGYPDYRQWGKEDSDLYEKVEKLLGSDNIKRTIYSDAIHQWHSDKK